MKWLVFDTSWGWAAVLSDNKLIKQAILPSDVGLNEFRSSLESSGMESRLIGENDVTLPLINNFRRYFQGHLVENWEAKWDIDSLPAFTQQVLKHVSNIPYGVTKTYGEVARAISNPRAARAVGRALSLNPLPLLIPCHRVLAQNGGLGGFTAPGGVETKKALLALENEVFISWGRFS
ncbi:MAG: MGMT family protein [Syntrophomonas sp.]|uniref:methylated-DNA--[protein]-cysteine S-methyltransferase n=1 Tax=Syntrophomonas sp. TaxID=2053627 RepID=UPI00262ECF4B|nr:MGMT family protein [Syntrophomonas sp.]MDD2511029.1 MGMT family protein [Syntrophomonas sp.]MDD3879270.1 MGMT family protein [Syntrophomonas sp.]MDD4625924.1 MGMT family protein [Syntrophomonas sp.]